jgi:hypothetical protein
MLSENQKNLRKHMTKRFNLLLLFLVTTAACFATNDSTFVFATDTLHIEERSVDQNSLDEFKADSQYQYGRPQEGVSPWQRFVIWILSIIGKFLLFATQTLIGKAVFYLLLIGILIWVILKLLNIDAKDLFYRGSAERKINHKLSEENIHELDFEKLIDTAVSKNEYRSAVRLTFLYALQKLSDAQVINWLPGKTNDDYLKEVKQHAASSRLQELRYYFDYAWYGHFEINENTYQDVKQSFQELRSTLR